jgi:murein DD-endopeptidase MepM/ murein hydrolase activator NlpD
MIDLARHSPAEPRRARWLATRRVVVVAAFLTLSSLLSAVAGAAPSQEDVDRAEARLERVEDRLAAIRERVQTTQLLLNEAAAEVEKRQVALEQVTVALLRTEARLERARARYERISSRLNDRAVAAYMAGPASSLDLLLGADSIAQLTDRIAYVDALAQSDAELAVDVANLKNQLVATRATLEEQQERRLLALESAREKEREVNSLFGEQQALAEAQERLFGIAQKALRRIRADRREWLEEQRAAFGEALGGRVWQGGSLAPFDGVLQVCPVAQPRAFGDGFGAPRYAGGYHLHKGVDIVAPLGTEILAPFDGHAYTSSNSLGGNVVFVVGSQGTVYNAHLHRYSASSNSSVSAGEVIGYVGSTGSSSTPHDHFEFHPNAMPSGWFQSPYGYGQIEDAINPYPLLIQACG